MKNLQKLATKAVKNIQAVKGGNNGTNNTTTSSTPVRGEQQEFEVSIDGLEGR